MQMSEKTYLMLVNLLRFSLLCILELLLFLSLTQFAINMQFVVIVVGLLFITFSLAYMMGRVLRWW